MSRSLCIDKSEPIEFCSNMGWTGVINWVNDLDPETYPGICHFADHGYHMNAESLHEELEKALKDNPPSFKDTLVTCQELMKLLDDSEEDTFVSITDGLC